MPRVSVIVPVYKAEKYISRCISSIQSQTLQDWELILVNDGSPDQSVNIIRSLELRDNRIKLIDNQENHGPMVVRHQGFLEANGDYFTFVDSDDWLPNDALEKLFNKAVETNADIVSGRFIHINEDGIESFDSIPNVLKYGYDRLGAFRAVLNRDITQTVCSKLFKTSTMRVNKYEIFDHSTNGEDAGVLFQYIERSNKVVTMPNGVYYYFENIISSSHNTPIYAMESICKNTRLRYDILKQYEDLKTDMNKYFTNNLIEYSVRTDNLAIIYKYGIEAFVSMPYVFKYVPFSKVVKYYVKKFLRKY